ncbi:MFS transporter [Nocardia speluncae]|uniref:MFS transporter n=1 Tax=Nocardia speluncae TaxID=419477 RepID=A0A846XGJ5_9NOCA|nr:MFS transporter [Nocardia speluncae]NKY33004.1 MFS transporter [Nocardia speluncae]
MPTLLPPPLRRRNFLLYFCGQICANTGVWFQNLALSLWIVETTESALALSLVAVFQFTPMLLLSAPAGAVADRFRPRTILFVTAPLMALSAAALAVTAASGHDELTTLLGIVALSGIVQAFDRTAGQAFLYELVGARELGAAVSLNTVALSAARSLGPGLAGVTYAAAGAATCFTVNALTYSGVLLALCVMNPKAFAEKRARTAATDKGAARTLLADTTLLRLFGANIAVTVLAMNFMVVVTAMVTITLDGDPAQLGAAHTLNAVGAVIGGLIISTITHRGTRVVALATAVLGISLGSAALAPNPLVFLAISPLIGLGLGAFQSSLNSTVQQLSPPRLLGRSAGLLTMSSVGVAPVGALIAGSIIDNSSARIALLVGTVTCLVCGAVLAKGGRTPHPAPEHAPAVP